LDAVPSIKINLLDILSWAKEDTAKNSIVITTVIFFIKFYNNYRHYTANSKDSKQKLRAKTDRRTPPGHYPVPYTPLPLPHSAKFRYSFHIWTN
jgi:hypothetical protein